MRKEPIRHHYIPQFILRNFSNDDNKKFVYYFDKEKQLAQECPVCEVFMERNLYRDEINNTETPVKIEYDLAKFEGEISGLINSKFSQERIIEITAAEDNKLKLFLAIMSYRGLYAKEQLAGNPSKKSRSFNKYFQPNEDYEDFWKRNLGYLVQCRSIDEVINHPQIDLPIKMFMRRDVNGLCGKYFIVVEAKEGESFVIGDCYPLVIFGDSKDMILYEIFSISPKRAIILACRGVEATPRNVLTLRLGIFDPPKENERGNIVITRRRLLSEEVRFINQEIAKNSSKGIIYLHTN